MSGLWITASFQRRKEKRDERKKKERRKEKEGDVKRPVLCDAAAGIVWPS